MALSSQLQNQVRQYLMNSPYLDGNDSLRRLFIDTRISMWRNNLPEAGSRASRANAVIAAFDKMNNGYNVLALILQVIVDNTPHGDAAKGQGAELARQVQAGSTESQRAEYERELAQLEEHHKHPGWIDDAYYNKRRPQLLALIAQFGEPQDIPVDNLPPNESTIQMWKDEFAASAKALVEARAIYSIYTQYEVESTDVMRAITKATARCAELAEKLKGV